MAEEKKKSGVQVYESPETLYKMAVQTMKADEMIVQFQFKIENYQKAASMFDAVGDYQNARELAKKCRKLIEETKAEQKQDSYKKALRLGKTAETQTDYQKIFKELEKVTDNREAEEYKKEIQQKLAGFEKKAKRKKTVTGMILAVLVVLLAFGFTGGYFRYLKGYYYVLLEKYNLAANHYEKLGDFLDSEEKVEKYKELDRINRKEKEEKNLVKAKETSEFEFGTHTWKVLERQGNEILMIATQVNDKSEFYHVKYNNTDTDVTWEDSDLRNWLNTEVLEQCFDEEEKALLCTMTAVPSSNSEYHTDGGSETTDYVRILDTNEAEKYMKVVKTLGLDCWLRTPGHAQDTAAYVSGAHSVMNYGYPVNSDQLSVRPVILVDCTPLMEEDK